MNTKDTVRPKRESRRLRPTGSSNPPFRNAILIMVGLGLFQCERTAVYDPKSPDNAHYRVFHLGTYSTKLDEENEREGTIFQTTTSFDLEKQGSGWTLRRKLDTLMARGYHKFSMPHELEKKVALTIVLDSAFIPARIDGYDSLKAVLGRIQQKDDYRKQLLASTDTARYRVEWRDWWRMNNFLPKGVKLEALKPLPVDAINKTLESLQLDSAFFQGPRPRLKKDCLDYTLYYHRTDSLVLLMEQFYFSSIQNRKFRKYSWGPSVIVGTLHWSVDRKTGLPCFQSRTEISEVSMELKEEKVKTPVHLYRYEEDLYEF
ncbi:MAG: hypothetical protein M3Y08_15330 [Fibrobacterota bacterium]|nr:hypothetical protein [Fibrobacterota bacterium]